MTIATINKIKMELKGKLLKEFIIPILKDIKDAEGEYQHAFALEILKAVKEKHVHKYNSKIFLKLIA